MKKTIPISLRSSLISASVDFLGQEDMNCLVTQDALPELISQLSQYKEEGKSLYPEIYIFDDIELVKKVLINFQYYQIGEGIKTKATMLKALKKCAPLTENGWAIYILRKNNTFEYGVFRSGTSILSVSVSDTLISDGTDSLKVISIHQVAEKLIEVKGVKADTLLISFSSNDGMKNSPIELQQMFIDKIIMNVKPEIKDPCINFFKRIFLDVLQRGHGTLACVISHKKKKVPKKLQDGIILQNRIDIPSAIEELLDKDDLLANAKVEGQLTLIAGMMQSDGITVFTDKGEVLCYNVFVKHPRKLASTTGGARSRTFLTLNGMIPKDIEATYIQSQDGKIEFYDGK